VAHAYNPSYSGGRDQEDHGSKPALAISMQDPILKKPFTKQAGGVARVVECLPSKHKALSSNPTKNWANESNSSQKMKYKWPINTNRNVQHP
jgi:hypothetical protein